MSLTRQPWGEGGAFKFCIAALKCWGCPALCRGKEILELAGKEQE